MTEVPALPAFGRFGGLADIGFVAAYFLDKIVGELTPSGCEGRSWVLPVFGDLRMEAGSNLVLGTVLNDPEIAQTKKGPVLGVVVAERVKRGERYEDTGRVIEISNWGPRVPVGKGDMVRAYVGQLVPDRYKKRDGSSGMMFRGHSAGAGLLVVMSESQLRRDASKAVMDQTIDAAAAVMRSKTQEQPGRNYFFATHAEGPFRFVDLKAEAAVAGVALKFQSSSGLWFSDLDPPAGFMEKWQSPAAKMAFCMERVKKIEFDDKMRAAIERVALGYSGRAIPLVADPARAPGQYLRDVKLLEALSAEKKAEFLGIAAAAGLNSLDPPEKASIDVLMSSVVPGRRR